MNWKDKKVLVTGAGGFIGSHLAEELVRRGASLRAFVHYNALGKAGWLDALSLRNDVELVWGDVCDSESINRAVCGVEYVFHLAALIGIPYSYINPRAYMRTNVEGTLNALQAGRENGIEKFVHTSTSEVYGSAQKVPMPESHPLCAMSPYAATKIGADKLAEAFTCSFDLPVVTVRPFNTYGPRQSERAIIPTAITQCLKGQTLKVGNLTPTRDLNYVRDTADGFIAVAESGKTTGQTVNLGTGVESSIEDLIRKIQELCGVDLPVEVEAQRQRSSGTEVTRLCSDTSRIRQLTDWRPRFDLEAGLKETIDWFRENRGDRDASRYVV